MLRLALALAFAQSGFHGFVASLPLAMLAAGRSDAEIGALMGFAAVVNIPAALVSGGLIDRFGARRVFIAGAGAFSVGSVLLATGLVTAGGPSASLLAVRALQGIGLAAVLPAGLSLVPLLVSPARLGTALGLAGMGANVSLALAPPVSLAILSAASLPAVAGVFFVTVLAGALLIWSVRPRERGEGEEPPADDRTARARSPESRGLRTLWPTWRGSWTAPVAIALLFLVHWGVVVGYLPQRAAVAGADIGPFFTGDALALLALRVPSGYLAGRLGSLRLILAGLLVTTAAVALLLVPPTTFLLFIAGIGGGAGAALVLPPLMLEFSNRSSEADRGSAFALFTVSFSVGIAIGSLGMAPLIDRIGFENALLIGMSCLVAAAGVALVDRRLRQAAPLAAAG